jgi:hypothetical protein
MLFTRTRKRLFIKINKIHVSYFLLARPGEEKVAANSRAQVALFQQEVYLTRVFLRRFPYLPFVRLQNTDKSPRGAHDFHLEYTTLDSALPGISPRSFALLLYIFLCPVYLERLYVEGRERNLLLAMT